VSETHIAQRNKEIVFPVMEIQIVKSPINKKQLEEIAKQGFGLLVKAVVDVGQGIIAIGGELHSDEEVKLMEEEMSKRGETWGINLYPGKIKEEWIEFDSMVNIKPSFDNYSRDVENPETKEKIRNIVDKLIIE
jgi:hypothetical protein